MSKRIWLVALMIPVIMGSLIGCGNPRPKTLYIEWIPKDRAISNGPYIDHAPSAHLGGGFSARCRDEMDNIIPATWAVDNPEIVHISGPHGEDPSGLFLEGIVGDPLAMGRCVLTATTEVYGFATANVQILGNLELNYAETPTTVYFKIRNSGVAEMPSADGADIALNVIGPIPNTFGMDYNYTCLGTNRGKAYPEREGPDSQYNFEPSIDEMTEIDLPRAENIAFVNAEGDIVTVTISCNLDRSHIFFFIH